MWPTESGIPAISLPLSGVIDTELFTAFSGVHHIAVLVFFAALFVVVIVMRVVWLPRIVLRIVTHLTMFAYDLFLMMALTSQSAWFY